MTPRLESMVASAYVTDVDTSRAFYELLGFREHSTGRADAAAWCYMYQNRHFVLLTSTQPPLGMPRLPLLFYFFYEDVDAVVSILDTAGVEATHVGYPPHALGGEVKVLDPDGNTVLLGQRERSPSQPAQPDGAATAHFSLLEEAAALVEASGGSNASCQVRCGDGTVCAATAEVRVADPAGGTAWACLAHADEILMTVPGAFLASPRGQGIAEFRSRRR